MKTLLVGNDVNNINNKQSWEQLLQDIVDFCGARQLVKELKGKPFPLLYEEILLKAQQRGKVEETALKRFIAGEMGRLSSNAIHARIRSMNVKDVLTTNYDFNLSGLSSGSNKGKVTEKRFSVFRHYLVQGKRWWHIHGDCRTPESINLGFEHYGSQLHRIRSYVATGVEYTSLELDPLLRRLGKKNYTLYSWIDLFFTHELHILGLGLDFVETDLWWLLTWRARQQQRFPGLVKNRITYYIPEHHLAASQPRLDLFDATGVRVVPLKAADKEAYYRAVLDRVERSR